MKQGRILLADDHALILEGFQTILAPYYEVVGAVTDGVSLVEEALHCKPDLIILDISMAGMDGITALHRLREHGVSCPAIAFTARTEKVPGEFKSHGFSAYVSKTGDLSSLLETVRAVLNSRKRPTGSFATVA